MSAPDAGFWADLDAVKAARGKTYSDAEILDIRTKAFEEARRYSDNMLVRLEKAERLLSLAESFIPLSKRYDYELLSSPPSYGGTDGD